MKEEISTLKKCCKQLESEHAALVERHENLSRETAAVCGAILRVFSHRTSTSEADAVQDLWHMVKLHGSGAGMLPDVSELYAFLESALSEKTHR